MMMAAQNKEGNKRKKIEEQKTYIVKQNTQNINDCRVTPMASK